MGHGVPKHKIVAEYRREGVAVCGSVVRRVRKGRAGAPPNSHDLPTNQAADSTKTTQSFTTHKYPHPGKVKVTVFHICEPQWHHDSAPTACISFHKAHLHNKHHKLGPWHHCSSARSALHKAQRYSAAAKK